MKRSYLLLPFLLIGQLLVSQCTYLAYDGFDYIQNTTLEGQQGGSGWLSPWNVQNSDTTIPGYQIDNSSGSLVYNGLQTFGRHISGGQSYLTAGRSLNVDYDGPFTNYITQYGNGIGSLTGDTLYYSAVMNKNQDGANIFFGMHNAGVGWCTNCASQQISVGFFGANSTVGGQEMWSLNVNGNIMNSATPIVLNQNYFFVVRVIFNTTDTEIDLFIDPTNLGTSGAPANSTLNFTQNSNFALSQVAVYLGGQPESAAIDEIRFAESYSCVAPDNTVTVNQAPTAAFTYTPSSGISPFLVTLDGSISSDPEGNITTYEWHFGDGSPSEFGVSTTHTYSSIGELPITLTVTDDIGQQHSFINYVTVLDANNSFPCQTTVNSISRPTCTVNYGSIEVFANDASFNLRNSSNASMPISNGTQFLNLPPDEYTLYAQGNIGNGCLDTMHLAMKIDSSVCSGWSPSEYSLAIGSNISSLVDWGVERPMRNRFKHVRNGIIPYTENCFCWTIGDINELQFDSNGYPTHIPQATSSGNTQVRYVISSDGGNLQEDSTYVLLMDGQGTFELNGNVTIISQSTNRIEFSVHDSNNYVLNILTSIEADHLRNFRLLRIQDELEDLDANPFYDVFLDKIAPFEMIRYMDWGLTNNNPISDWSNRASESFFTYSQNVGVPYETMINLANQTKKDVWICVPHMADDNFIIEMATLFRDNLDDGIIIYLEYSNEVWNWIFDQAHYNEENKPANLNYGRAMAEKAGNVFRIWHSVFGDQKCKVKRVLGLQGTNNNLNSEIMSQLGQNEWDYGSPTAYFGLDHSTNGNPILNGSSTYQDVMQNAQNNWDATKSLLKQDFDNIHLYDKGIIHYEGGQHFVGNSFGIPYDYQQAMWDAQSSIEMYNMYDTVLDTIRSWGSTLFGNFSLATEQESVYGSWGVLPGIDAEEPYLISAPKYQALLDNGRDSIYINLLQWNGNENEWWSNVCNWTPTQLPTTNSNVEIVSGQPNDPKVDVNAYANSVKVSINVLLEILTPYTLNIEQ